MIASEVGTFLATLRVLMNKGIRYSTVIDVGCSDGNFFLHLSAIGLFPGAVPLNIDANNLYEGSLQAIKGAVGGDYRISAITDHEGEVELTTSVHPYWSSLRPENDSYWLRVNKLISTKRLVPATTLDTLRQQLALIPPYLIKLDIQASSAARSHQGAERYSRRNLRSRCGRFSWHQQHFRAERFRALRRDARESTRRWNTWLVLSCVY